MALILSQIVEAPEIKTKVRLARNAAFTTSVGWQDLPMDFVNQDVDNSFDAASGGVKVKYDGYYFCVVRARLNSPANEFIAGLRRAGTAPVSIAEGHSALGTNINYACGGAMLVMKATANDILIPYVYCSAALAITTGGFDTYYHVFGPF